MKAEKSQKSRKKAATPSQRGRKTSGGERNARSKKEEKPLRERLKSNADGDKRKTRRDFFTERTENKSRPARERNFEDRDRKTARPRREDDGRASSPRRRFDDGADRERPFRRNFGDDDRGERPTRRRFDDGADRERPFRRSFDDGDRKERPTRRRFDDGADRERPFRRNFGDDDRRERPTRRRFDDGADRERPSRRSFDDGDRNERPTRRRFEENDNFSSRFSDRPHRGKNRFEDKPSERRSYRDRDNENQRHRFDDENNERKPRRRKPGMESDIIRDIVHKRRETGRYSERRPKVLALSWNEDRGLIRLNKYISNSGICSRREADDLIIAGAVTVNGNIVTELGAKVLPTDEVRYEDKILQREKPVYILLNKPKDYITTTEDDRGRDNVMMLIEGACEQRVYPVGRLDRNTTGLLLFTNDGEMTKKLTHPRFGIKKIYQVELDRDLKQEDYEALKNGIELVDGFMQPDELEYVDGKKILGITLHSGKNRIVRRLFNHLDYEVEKLDRVYYAGLTKKNLSRGEWRILQQSEVNMLKMSI